MKLLLTIAHVCLAFVCFAQSTAVPVQTSFNGFHCDGKPGICSIDNQTSRSISNATLTFNKNHTLTLSVARHKLKASEFNNLMGVSTKSWNQAKTYFITIPTTFIISDAIRDVLTKSTKPLAISKGRYPIHASTNSFSITFNLE